MGGTEFAAVVLAGGTGARLGGADKASIEVDGRTLLEHALDAVVDAAEVVVVGEAVPTSRPVTFTREDPPGGGPAAGLLAGRDALVRHPAVLGVLAVDMPYVDAHTFRRLRDALAVTSGADGAFLVDREGRRQLAGVLVTARLRDPDDRHGLPFHRLLDGLELVPVPAVDRESLDVDTWADVRDLRSGP